MALRIALQTVVVAALVSWAGSASAAPPFVDRSITLPRHDLAFNFGLGIAHAGNNSLGPGINLEGAGAFTSSLELGFRTGLRFGDVGRVGRADRYGRPFDTETYGEGADVVLSNPEARLRWAVVQGDVVEVALEGRAYSPFTDGFGLMFGVPMAFHLGRIVRFDTGVFVPILFHNPTEALVSLPFHLWIQATDKLWLGPLTGVRFYSNAGGHVDVPLGFGLGYQVSRAVDFKTWLLFQDVANGAAREWGFGAGVELRIE
jgi:hypothetical protein